MHQGLKGRDIFGETARLCHDSGIAVVCYLSLIYDVWAYDTHPDWRIIRCDGKPAAFNMRYGVCCPNSPYRAHMASQVRELCTMYDFEVIRFDMTFWPPGAICYCRHCRLRYADEVGGDIPTTVDWEDARWVAFQRCRERWLIEFAALATTTARKYKPGVSVEHQASTFTDNWQRGVTLPLADQCDFLQGDFYGGIMQGFGLRGGVKHGTQLHGCIGLHHCHRWIAITQRRGRLNAPFGNIQPRGRDAILLHFLLVLLQ